MTVRARRGAPDILVLNADVGGFRPAPFLELGSADYTARANNELCAALRVIRCGAVDGARDRSVKKLVILLASRGVSDTEAVTGWPVRLARRAQQATDLKKAAFRGRARTVAACTCTCTCTCTYVSLL